MKTLKNAKKPAWELTLTRVIDAPRERVFDAWSKPEQVARWFAPGPLTLPKCEMDFRAGGKFRMTMRAPDGTEYPFSGVYREIARPSRMVWVSEFPNGPAEQVQTEIDFEAQGRKTKLTVRQLFWVLTPETEPATKGAKQGWTATLDQLTALCESGDDESVEREISITRVFDAPRERVWRAWADPEQIVKWWGPRGFSTTSDRREFKPGGVWRHTMIGPDGTKFPNLARFEEIVEPERIVYTNGGGKEGGQGVSMRTTVTFKALGGKTELTLRHVFETAAMREIVVKEYGAIEGGKQTMARLAEHLDGEFVLTRLLDAPRELVWTAWTEPERLAAWFGPKGVRTASASMELKPGGVYHYGMSTPDGKKMWGKWTFREIVRPERLVFVSSFSDENRGITRHPMSATWPLETLSTILFDDMGGKTLLTIKWSALNANDVERKTFLDGFAGMSRGWGGTMEQLVAYLLENK